MTIKTNVFVISAACTLGLAFQSTGQTMFSWDECAQIAAQVGVEPSAAEEVFGQYRLGVVEIDEVDRLLQVWDSSIHPHSYYSHDPGFQARLGLATRVLQMERYVARIALVDGCLDALSELGRDHAEISSIRMDVHRACALDRSNDLIDTDGSLVDLGSALASCEIVLQGDVEADFNTYRTEFHRLIGMLERELAALGPRLYRTHADRQEHWDDFVRAVATLDFHRADLLRATFEWLDRIASGLDEPLRLRLLDHCYGEAFQSVEGSEASDVVLGLFARAAVLESLGQDQRDEVRALQQRLNRLRRDRWQVLRETAIEKATTERILHRQSRFASFQFDATGPSFEGTPPTPVESRQTWRDQLGRIRISLRRVLSDDQWRDVQ